MSASAGGGVKLAVAFRHPLRTALVSAPVKKQVTAALVPGSETAQATADLMPAPETAQVTPMLPPVPLPTAVLLLAWIEIIACAVRIELPNLVRS